VLVAAILGSSLAFIDGTVVNVALPAVQKGLNATITDAQWVVEAYALFLSALLLVGGSLGDHYGRRRVYSVGIVLFALASAACGFASRIEWLIAARALQGFGARAARARQSRDPERRVPRAGTRAARSEPGPVRAP
jgi:MFS family permease